MLLHVLIQPGVSLDVVERSQQPGIILGLEKFVHPFLWGVSSRGIGCGHVVGFSGLIVAHGGTRSSNRVALSVLTLGWRRKLRLLGKRRVASVQRRGHRIDQGRVIVDPLKMIVTLVHAAVF